MSSYYGQASSRSVWSEASGQQGQVYADPLNPNDEDYYYDANDQNRLDLLKLILYDLNSAIAPREVRLMAIQAALDEFDHDDDVLHDEELDLRADHILLQKLAYAMCIDPGSDEVGYICSALEMVYRAGRTRLAQSFHEICDSLLPLIVEMIRPPLPGKHSANKNRGSTSADEDLSSAEEKRDLLDGDNNSLNNNPFMEPVDPLNESRRFTYGDSDESSAESVQIPSGTGEYFEQKNRAKHDSNNVAQPDRTEPQSDNQGLVLKPIELGEEAIVPVPNTGDNTSGNALTPYNPVGNPRRSSMEIAEDTIRRDLTNADEAMRRLAPVESEELTQLVPAHNNVAGPMVAVNSNVGLQVESTNRATRLSGLTLESGIDEFKEQDEVMHLRGGGSGSVSSADDVSENVGQNSLVNEIGDDVPLFDPATMVLDSQSDAYGGSSVQGSFVYPESEDNPFSDENDYLNDHQPVEENESDFDLEGGFSGSAPQIRPLGESVQASDTYGAGYGEEEKITDHPRSDKAEINISVHEDSQNDTNNGAFDVGGGFSGDAPQIRPWGESVQAPDTYGIRYDEGEKNTDRPRADEANNNISDHEDNQNDINNGAFDVGGGFYGSAPDIRPLGESVQVTDGYYNNRNKVEEEDDEIAHRPGLEGAEDIGSNEFDVGGGFSGSAPHIRPLGESVQVTDSFAVSNGDDEESYLPQKRQSELTDEDWGSRRDSDVVDHNENKRHSGLSDEDWESRGQSELDEWSENKMRQSEYTDNFSADQEYGQRLDKVEEEEDSHDPTFRNSGVEEDIFQFREPEKMPKSVDSEASFLSDHDNEFVCDLAIQKVLKILRYFSRVLSAMELLAQQPGLVDSLLYRMKKAAQSNDENEISARVDAIAVIVNLACAEENKILLVYHPGLLDAVINIANHDPIEEAREHAAIVLMNLVRLSRAFFTVLSLSQPTPSHSISKTFPCRHTGLRGRKQGPYGESRSSPWHTCASIIRCFTVH